MHPSSFDYRRKAMRALRGNFGLICLIVFAFLIIFSIAAFFSILLYNQSGWADYRSNTFLNMLENTDPNRMMHYNEAWIRANLAYLISGTFWLRRLIILGGIIVGLFFVLAYSYIMLEIANERKLTSAGVLRQLARAPYSFWLSINILIRALPHFLLLVVPGLIKLIEYGFAYFIKLDNPELSAKECIRQSSKLTDGHKLRIFLLCLSFLGMMLLAQLVSFAINLLATIVIPGFVWQFVSPFVTAAVFAPSQALLATSVAYMYRDRKGDKIFPKRIMLVSPHMLGFGMPPPNQFGNPHTQNPFGGPNPYNANPYSQPNPYGIQFDQYGMPIKRDDDNPYGIPLPRPKK